ncbi:DNA repair exonuclease SbcCD nuclease subunit [Proteiniborus ethanoligenes]|uniref:DNA repair exonuclease SbcCD nuclease subunit n=1 Tax=Proteiniborus ethanoligenes TaxID=415015 RepID=A0A1H3P6A4_9FIRM|nr:DNA repair exonuclease [Proteiniborus ethanoligenes]TAH63191.1 MAG: DNA repair exonuclease [Gottschalkiaceae bacterium]SDY96637.1 DNA repair exonuclease SbcCD nuclease subunit [Proteiniborus ethanoligenes]
MVIKCIHTGDIHLGMEFKSASFDKKQANTRRLELWETFNRIIDRCKEIGAHILLVAGDLFEDDYCTISDIKRIDSMFREISDTKVIISAGNHDTLGKRSLYKLIKWGDNVHIFEPNTVSKLELGSLNTVVWGLSWDKKLERQRLIDGIKVEDNSKINILLAHGDALSKESSYLPIDKNRLINSGFDYIALGHIHKHQFLSPNICYCGSPEPLDFGETGSHGIIEGQISKYNTEMEFKPFAKRKFIIKEITINENIDYNEIIDIIKTIDNKESRDMNLYRVVLSGTKDRDIEVNTEDLKEYLKNDFYYIEIIDNTTPDYDLDKIYMENSNNILGLFIEEMRNKGLDNEIVKDALYYGLEALLSEKVKK